MKCLLFSIVVLNFVAVLIKVHTYADGLCCVCLVSEHACEL